ncbi:MAG: hypothetical protein OEU62_01690 [Gammaproteobacteria bacterium]|jgi:hypothetical protein|nr:hypothetical protein [Gammaproteobacteria bacterium]
MLLVWINAFGAGEPLKFQLASAGEDMAAIAAIDIEAKATDRYMLVPPGRDFSGALHRLLKICRNGLQRKPLVIFFRPTV